MVEADFCKRLRVGASAVYSQYQAAPSRISQLTPRARIVVGGSVCLRVFSPRLTPPRCLRHWWHCCRVSVIFFSEANRKLRKGDWTVPERCDHNCQEKYEDSNKIEMSTVARLVTTTIVPLRAIKEQVQVLFDNKFEKARLLGAVHQGGN